ncbi:chromate efflux transporter [Melioribacteraceae bacterium 4301-Me]|uniref:chromate efflux transporter n=1 Tax=Pyranulibacter aquaticus TaxID=3163344 RepID=UPI00359B6116
MIELIKVFLKLGLIAFGGPAAHIAMFEEEIVTKRKWMSREHFLDLVGATNLIPGPNSTEMAMHCGYHKAGILGALVSGLSFMFPAVMITGIISYFYLLYGTLPQVEPFLYGIKPAVIVIIMNAVVKLGMKAAKGWKLFSIAAVVAFFNIIGVNEIFSILFGGIFGALFLLFSEHKNKLNSFFPLTLISLFNFNSVIQSIEKAEVSLTKLFLTCLKIGIVWFGSGYILVAYFNGEFVEGLHWLTRQVLLDAIAVGQFTPGPLLSSATFIGYQISKITGAILATAGIVIPSFIFVLILNPLIPRIRKSIYLSKFLDSVNASAVAVMFVVGIKLGIEILADSLYGINWRTTLIAVLSAVALLRIKKVNSAYIVLSGALLGYLLELF